MKKFLYRVLGWTVTGIFMFGVYAIAHYILHAEDRTLMFLAGALLWSDMAEYVNKDDAKASG